MTSAWDIPESMMTGIKNVGEGWHELVRELEKGLNTLDSTFELVQIKEKFGGLRYYAAPRNDAVSEQFHQLISLAEEASFKICEECGESGENRSIQGWYKTLCDQHYNDALERRKQA